MNEGIESPDGWQCVELKDIAELNPKLPFDTIPDDLDVSFLPMKLVEEETNKIHLSEFRKYSEVRKGFTPMTDGDVIFAKITPCMENGKIAVVHSLRNKIAFGSTEFHVFRCNHAMINSFLFYFLVQSKVRKEAQQNMSGAVGQRRVPTKYLHGLKIPLPPFPEQQRIVAKIEELFSSLDKGIESLKTAQQQLKVYRQAVLKWAFEGRLTVRWREENKDNIESASALLKRIQAEREKHYKKQLADWQQAVNEWGKDVKNGKKPGKPIFHKQLPPLTKEELDKLQELPQEWGWARAEEICSPDRYSIGIGPFGSNLKVSDYRDKGIPLIFVKNITRSDFRLDLKYIDETKYKELSPHSVMALDLLITKMGDPPGDCEIYPANAPVAVLTADCLKIKIWDEFLERMFFKFCIKSHSIKEQLGLITSGVAQKKISVDRFKTICFPLPSREEQKQIVAEIESRLSVCEKIEEAIEQGLKQAEALRQSILKKAFEGRLVPQDPDDEPAGMLLERIRKEREKVPGLQKKTRSRT